MQNITFQVKKEGEHTYIFCLVRKKYILLTPEEKVRQYTLKTLVEQANYPLNFISVEKTLTVNGMKKRWDILVFNKSLQPWLLIECKNSSLSLNQQTLRQVGIYNVALQVPYLAITNGNDWQMFQIDFEAAAFKAIDNFPVW
ncbi:MAG: type I restriction enzyme HsdR N-terminal domain-containing protein [Chitinophagales bacterium]|nr:type I restriction enzyme HsdR N-terminal domain-containing protein [Chitinophagales bacterium]